MANDPALAQLADMLKRTQHRRVMENMPPPTPPATAQASLPPFQIPGMNDSPVGTPPFMPPQRQAMPAPAPPPVTTPPVVAPGDQTLPSTVTRSATAADAGNPISQPMSVWDTFKKMPAQGQVPEGYRGAMGEMIKNS